MLEVVEPVDESRTAIAFATEPIFASLSNLLGNYENLPSVPEDIRKFELDELEVKTTLMGDWSSWCTNNVSVILARILFSCDSRPLSC